MKGSYKQLFKDIRSVGPSGLGLVWVSFIPENNVGSEKKIESSVPGDSTVWEY